MNDKKRLRCATESKPAEIISIRTHTAFYVKTYRNGENSRKGKTFTVLAFTLEFDE